MRLTWPMAVSVYAIAWNEKPDDMQGIIHPTFYEHLCKAGNYSYVQFLIDNAGFSQHLDGT